MPLLLCRRADLRFALDSTGLVRVLSADEIAAQRERSFLSESLIPCDPAVLFDATASDQPARDLPAAAGLLFRHGDLQILVAVDRVERQAPKDRWDLRPLPTALRTATAGLITRMACRPHAPSTNAPSTNAPSPDLLPLLHLAALWEDAAFPSTTSAHAPKPRFAVPARNTNPGVLHWPLAPNHSTRLAISFKQVYELTSAPTVVPLPGLPPALPGVSLWRDRLLTVLNPQSLFLHATSSLDSSPLDPSCATGSPGSFSGVPLLACPAVPDRLPPAQTRYALVIATEQGDDPLLLLLPTLPQRLRHTTNLQPARLSSDLPDSLLHGRFQSPHGPLLLPAWHRTLSHALFATPEPVV
jgi:hypothetical protein